MSFEEAPTELRCAQCECEITVQQYRRKLPRCDECEIAAAVVSLEEELADLRRPAAGF